MPVPLAMASACCKRHHGEAEAAAGHHVGPVRCDAVSPALAWVHVVLWLAAWLELLCPAGPCSRANRA